MVFLFIILFIAVPLIEIWLIIEIGGLIGVWPTIAILLADSLLGALLLNRQGRTAWRRFKQALAEHRVPHREVLDGVLIVFGGALLLTPGFLTDVLGFVLLIPPTRMLVRKILTRYITLRVSSGRTAFSTAQSRQRTGQDYDVEGTAEDIVDTPQHKRTLNE